MARERTEADSLGLVQVSTDAAWGAQTQRAIDNFSIGNRVMPPAFIRALGLIKQTAARVNAGLDLLSSDKAAAIGEAAAAVAAGRYADQFPVGVYQTGSGTSSHMNANEVIAHLASEIAGVSIHPNDDVNLGQSSNDVVPSAIRISAILTARDQLLPAMDHLCEVIAAKANDIGHIIKTGRTHLMDATPLSLGQEFSAWSALLTNSRQRITGAMQSLSGLPLGGTAVGTGINAHPQFGQKVCAQLTKNTGIKFRPLENLFSGISGQSAPLEMSGAVRDCAVVLGKIAEDLRWMNSGPNSGLAEVVLPVLQPGSSIMPGKVNPVVPEAVAMAAVQIGALDQAVARACASGNFQLNVMLPLIAANLDEMLQLASGCARSLADQAIAGLTVNTQRLAEQLTRNPILVTALNPVIGYEKAAEIARTAYKTGRPIREVALEMTHLSAEEIDRLLDPANLI